MKFKIFVFILRFFPKSLAHKLLYLKVMGKKLNLKKPNTLNEKLQWLIVNEYGKREADLTDKILSKKILKNKKIKKLSFPKTLYTIDNKKDLDFEYLFKILPNKFVMKCNHGSGNVFICKNKKDFNLKENINILFKDLKKDYSKTLLEYHYSIIKPQIFFEEYLDDNVNQVPLDYKFFCFDGIPKCVMVCSNRKNGNYDATFYDKDWNKLSFSTHPTKNEIKKPNNLEEMWDISSKLSKEHKFVRVDLYSINGEIYFGEMTFTPAAAMSKTYTEKADKILGSYLKLK